MLPPDLAAFSFTLDPAGSDAALADRTRAACAAPDVSAPDAPAPDAPAPDAPHVAVFGAQRWGLLRELARAGLRVTAFDASRTALGVVRRALDTAAPDARIALFAADPRDLDLPGGADALLVPSSPWRTILHREGRAAALASFRRALRPGGRLLLDVDRPPLGPGAEAPAERTHLRAGPGGQAWWWRRGPVPGSATVGCDAPRAAAPSIDVALLGPDDVLDEVRRAGFVVLSCTDAATGAALGPASHRAWIVAGALAARPEASAP